MGAVADGFCAAFQAIQEGIEPDPDMWVDEWADAHMVLPTGKSAEPGQYRISRTPYARAVLVRHLGGATGSLLRHTPHRACGHTSPRDL